MLLLGVGLGLWYWLERVGPKAGWLVLEGPARARVDEEYPLRIRLQLPPNAPSEILRVNLHWCTRSYEPRRFLADGGSRPIDAPTMDTEFRIRVPDRPDLGFIRVIVYTSPSGRWADRTRMAYTHEIPVERGTGAPADPTVRRHEVHREDFSPEIRPERSVAMRRLTAVMMLAAAVAGGAGWWRRRNAPSAGSLWEMRLGLGLACGCAALGWVDFLDLGFRAGEALRGLARVNHVYNQRTAGQQAATVIVVVAGLGVLVKLARIRLVPSVRGGLVAAVTYGILTMVGGLSLHATDAWLGTAWAGYPILQWLKLACAVAGLAAAASWLGDTPSLPRRHTTAD